MLHLLATVSVAASLAVMSGADCASLVHGTCDRNSASLLLVQNRVHWEERTGQQSENKLKHSKMHPGDRLGDMFVPAPFDRKFVSSSFGEEDEPFPTIDPHATPMYPVDDLKQNLTMSGCQNMEDDTRIALIELNAKYHGSTAIASVLMSSPHVTTLCVSDRWQCEGVRVIGGMGMTNRWDYKMSEMLEKFSRYWDLSRPLLFDKSLDIGVDSSLRLEIDTTELPAEMTNAGIKKLNRVYLLVWRPLCLWSLSSHAREKAEKDRQAFAANESEILGNLSYRHKQLLEAKTPVLVVNLADLIWRPSRNEQRLLEFMPCLEDVDADYVPILNKDIFDGNFWKADGSVASYGESVNPKDMNYDVENQRCLGNDLFSHESELQAALEAVEYLRAFS